MELDGMEFIKEGTYTHASSTGAAPSPGTALALALKERHCTLAA